MALTKRKVDAAKPHEMGGKARRTDVWDREIPEFGLRIHPSGREAYIVRCVPRHGVRERHFTVGTASALTLERTRTMAKDVFGRVARGKDPAQKRQDARATNAAELSFRQPTDRKLEDQDGLHRRSVPDDRRVLG